MKYKITNDVIKYEIKNNYSITNDVINKKFNNNFLFPNTPVKLTLDDTCFDEIDAHNENIHNQRIHPMNSIKSNCSI